MLKLLTDIIGYGGLILLGIILIDGLIATLCILSLMNDFKRGERKWE